MRTTVAFFCAATFVGASVIIVRSATGFG